MEHVALTTEVRESPKVDEIRNTFAKSARGPLQGDDWKRAVRLFAEYCVEQDLKFCNIPTSYSGQLQVRHEFCASWGVKA
jgi:hypothetical protein